jgi:hypothetical protein
MGSCFRKEKLDLYEIYIDLYMNDPSFILHICDEPNTLYEYPTSIPPSLNSSTYNTFDELNTKKKLREKICNCIHCNVNKIDVI